MFYEEKRGGTQGSVPKRGQSPGVVFNYTPQKIVAPLTPVYIPQRNILQVNTTLNHGKTQLKQTLPFKFSVNNGYVKLNEYPNPVRRALSPQNIPIGNNSFAPFNHLPVNNIIQQK